jgi:methylthioribose-1-phosphate isomerase
MLSKMGVAKDENQYYNETHTKLKGLQTPTYSNLQSAVQRIDKFVSTKQNANMRAARAASNAAAAATAQQERNKEAVKYGLPPGSKSENILAARLALLRRGGRRKTKRRSTKRRSTRRKV